MIELIFGMEAPSIYSQYVVKKFRYLRLELCPKLWT